jgi:hypothetical protein
LDTVMTDTPASLATSFKVARADFLCDAFGSRCPFIPNSPIAGASSAPFLPPTSAVGNLSLALYANRFAWR